MKQKRVNFIFLTFLYAHFERRPNISFSTVTKTTVRSPRWASGPTKSRNQKETGKCKRD